MRHLDYGNREVFLNHLIYVHALMKASEPLLIHAIHKSKPGFVQSYYIKHLGEEQGHAKWLEADLLTAGVVPPKVHWRAAKIAGMQAYLIECVNPVALLGYMTALETNAPPMDLIEKLERAYGTTLIRTLRYHAKHDINHAADLAEVVEQLNDENRALVRETTKRTLEML